MVGKTFEFNRIMQKKKKKSLMKITTAGRGHFELLLSPRSTKRAITFFPAYFLDPLKVP